MLIKDALKYSDKVRRREWRPECYLVVGDGKVVDENGSDCHGYYELEAESEKFNDWEPVPLPGSITILCRECGEEFYASLIEDQYWTVQPKKSVVEWKGITCPNCGRNYDWR